MSKSVLVVAAHADDEVLGCGGTIARHVSEGDSVTVVFMTDGVSSREEPDAYVNKDERESAAQKALNILGVTDIHQFDFPDNMMDSVPLIEIVKEVESVVSCIKPEIIYTHFANDLNIDHRITHNAVLTACRPQSNQCVKKILSFEILSSTEWNGNVSIGFNPQYFVDINLFWEHKSRALQCYSSELRQFPHSRSLKCIEALAVVRGATNGLHKAEAFVVERFIV